MDKMLQIGLRPHGQYFGNSMVSLSSFPSCHLPHKHTFFVSCQNAWDYFFLDPFFAHVWKFPIKQSASQRISLPLCSRPPLAFAAAVLSRYLFPSQDTCIHCLFFIVVYETSAVYELFPLNAIIFLVLCSNKQLWATVSIILHWLSLQTPSDSKADHFTPVFNTFLSLS